MTFLNPLPPPGNCVFKLSVTSHLRDCKCFCYTLHLHFCSRYRDPYFCHLFSCVSLLQPEQLMWLCFLYSQQVRLSPFLLTLDHFLDVLYSLIRNTTCCSKDKDFQWHLTKHNYTQYFLRRSPNATELSATDIVFRKFNPKEMLVIFMERTVSICFKTIPKLLDLCYFHSLSKFLIWMRK